MFDITALGELLIDFTPSGISENGNILFERNPGGGPGNLLAAASKLGARTAFLGKVGDDMFGRFLEETLTDNNIDTSGMKVSRTVNTTLAFVQLDPNGDRSFSFYRNPGADMMLEEGEIDETIIKSSKIFHFSSISMTDEPAKSATLRALEIAKKNDLIISFDPNYRPMLWRTPDDAKREILNGLKYANILKISDEEMAFITGESDMATGTECLRHYGINFIIVTLGKKGLFYKIGDMSGSLPTYNVKTIDTTGAGDAFLGGLLFKLKDINLPGILRLKKNEIENILDFANAVGACSTTKKGGIPSMPQPDEVEHCLKHMPKLIQH